MAPPFKVAPSNGTTQNELTKSSGKQNGSTKRNRSKSPENISNSIVNETPPSVGKIKILNLKRFTFAKLRSAAKSYSSKENGLTKSSSSTQQNGLTKSNGSKSPKNISWSIVNEAPSNTGNISWSIVDEAVPPGTVKIIAPNLKLFSSAKQKRAARNIVKIEAPNLKSFTFAVLKSATGNFSSEALLGEGGFGKVFKGWVHEKTYAPSKAGVGIAIAVKKLSLHSVQGVREWQSEIKFLANLPHPNIIKLVGYCSEDEELLLVYEFAQKGSLENNLFRVTMNTLTWGIRLKIAIEAARALAFLHTLEKPVIFRDFKASNILLDGNYNVKLSDFGLVKYAPSNGDTQVTTEIKSMVGPTNGDMEMTTQIGWPNNDTHATTQIGVKLGLANSDMHVTTQISWPNGDTQVTTQFRSTSGLATSNTHMITQIRGISDLTSGNKHVTTHIRTSPVKDGTHVTMQIGATLDPTNSCSHVTTRIIGTYGYIAPEYVTTGHLYIKSDVYSYGVVLLELLTGHRAVDTKRRSGMQNLVDWVKPYLLSKRKFETIMDLWLQDQYPSKGAFLAAQLALKCLNHDPKNRPSMVEVLENLEQIDGINLYNKGAQSHSSAS